MKSVIRFLWFLLFLLLALAGFIFTIRNPEPVSLWLGVQLAARPLSLWLLVSFIVGGLIGLSLGLGIWRGLKTRLALRQQRQRIEQQDLQLQELRHKLKLLEEQAITGRES
jgi:putative membrane protein